MSYYLLLEIVIKCFLMYKPLRHHKNKPKSSSTYLITEQFVMIKCFDRCESVNVFSQRPSWIDNSWTMCAKWDGRGLTLKGLQEELMVGLQLLHLGLLEWAHARGRVYSTIGFTVHHLSRVFLRSHQKLTTNRNFTQKQHQAKLTSAH